MYPALRGGSVVAWTGQAAIIAVMETTATEVLNATLFSREDLTESLSIVRIRPDSGEVPSFEPGQFVRLGLPKPDQSAPSVLSGGRPGRVRFTRRAYSIASSPLARDHLEFFVVRVEEGALTPRLWDIPVGGRLWMDSTAKGEFTMDYAPPGSDLVMVSTGTGIAPFMSMLRTFRARQPWRRFVVVHGTRFASDLGYRGELEQLARQDPSLVYVPLVTREPEGAWNGLRGRVQSALEPDTYVKLVGTPLDPAQCHVFLCGNPQMIDELEIILTQRGFVTDTREKKGNLHFERYW